MPVASTRLRAQNIAGRSIQEVTAQCLQNTDHELIPARNASLAAMQGSASGSNVRYYPKWKHSPFKLICFTSKKVPQVRISAWVCFFSGSVWLQNSIVSNKLGNIRLAYYNSEVVAGIWTLAPVNGVSDFRVVQWPTSGPDVSCLSGWVLTS
jgi:hypothetical protein